MGEAERRFSFFAPLRFAPVFFAFCARFCFCTRRPGPGHAAFTLPPGTPRRSSSHAHARCAHAREFSHSFTYGPWAQELMNHFYVNHIDQMPIDSPSYLNSSQNPNLY